MLKKFPFNDQTLRDLVVVNPERKASVSTTAGIYPVHVFTVL